MWEVTHVIFPMEQSKAKKLGLRNFTAFRHEKGSKFYRWNKKRSEHNRAKERERELFFREGKTRGWSQTAGEQEEEEEEDV